METLSQADLELLTPDEVRRYEELLHLEIARRSPLDCAEVFDPDCQRWPHIELLNSYIVALYEYRLYHDGPGPPPVWRYRLQNDNDLQTTGDIVDVPWDQHPVEVFAHHPESEENRVVFRLGIAMPPRHGKSYLVSEWLPVWVWLRWPDRDQALATYSDEFASTEWGVKLKDKINENQKYLGFSLRGGPRAATDNLRLNVPHRGRMKLVGAGGSLTGTGWFSGVIDDPFKNDEDALSPAVRQRKDNWYGSTWVTRKTRTGKDFIPVELMMFTRWHEDDIAGRRIYNELGEVRGDWCMLHLPALALENDLLGRSPGEALCPAVATKAELERLQEESPSWFAALYQGMPSLNESGTFGQFPTFKEGDIEGKPAYMHDQGHSIIADCVRFQMVDLAATTKSYSDWSVVATFDWDREHQWLYVVKIVRERVESETHEEWLTIHHDPTAVYMGIESQTYGLTALALLKRAGKVHTKPIKADHDKLMRAIRAADMARDRRIFARAGSEWLHIWQSEHSGFPFGKHDDQVDTTSMAANETLLYPPLPKPRKGPETMEERIQAHLDRRERQARRARRYPWAYV